MPSLTISLIVALVFTAGGYAITRAGRHAEALGGWLFALFRHGGRRGCGGLR